MQSIHELMEQIRDLVNEPWKHYELQQDNASFSQVVSAIDTIEDTEEAIRAFETEAAEKKVGKLYLLTYGLMQAFFLQQNAVEHLSEALRIEITQQQYTLLKIIKEVRNDSVGHPTKKDLPKSKPTSYHQISRISMSKDGFTLLSHYSDGRREVREISIPNLVADQNKFVSKMLTNVLNELKTENKTHKEKFRTEKLVDIFPHTLEDTFDNITKAIDCLNPVESGISSLNEIKSAFHSFHEALGRRDMDAYTHLQDDLKSIDHTILCLERILEAKKNGTDRAEDVSDGHSYLSFLRRQFDSFQKYAEQIDAEYAAE